MTNDFPTAHKDKLLALAKNGNLPDSDKPVVDEAIARYETWIKAMDELQGEGDDLLKALLGLANDYKKWIEVDLIFKSKADFLYRQNGQLKLSNSVLEEFLPRIFDVRLVPGLSKLPGIVCGPRTCFSHLSFGSPFLALNDGGIFLKTKDQDFAITKGYKVTIAETGGAAYDKQVSVAYFASEIKTNLDKTMFQEANATAGELKAAVPGARYILLCEWLDMSPIDTKLTPIDEVVILRKAKRLAANVRENFSTVDGRAAKLADYIKYLEDNPLNFDSFNRILFHLREVFPNEAASNENTILKRGYF